VWKLLPDVNGSAATGRWRGAVLVLLAAAIAAMRWHTFDEPREHDLDLYAWMGHYLFQGRALYTDILEIKPPLLYVLYGFAERLTGFNAAQFYLLGVASAGATLVGLYWFGAKALGRPWIGVVAAIFWTLLSSDLYLEANQPNTEVFINAFSVWAVASLWRLPADRQHWGACGRIGLLFACASLCKTVALAPAGILIGAKVLLAEPPQRGFVFRQMVLTAATIVICWSIVLAWLAAQGNLPSAILVLFVYPGEYASLNGRSVLGNVVNALDWQHLAPDFFRPHVWLLLICAAVLLIKINSEDRRLALYMLAWMCGTLLAVAAPGQFFPHYFQLWLPWLCAALALVIGWLPASMRSRRAVAVAAFAALWIGLRLYSQYQLDAEQWSIRKYGSQFVDARALGRELRTKLAPQQTLFVFGFSPGMYQEAGREPYNGMMNVWFALPNYGLSLSKWLNPRLLAQLQRSPPDVIVLDALTWAVAGPGEPVREWISSNYRVSESRNGYAVVVRATQAP
jgi:hypothetical protein